MPPINRFSFKHQKLKLDVNNEIDHADQQHENMMRMYKELEMKMFRTLREERELIMKLKGFCPGNKISRGILIQELKALKSAVERYKNAKKLDEGNEMMPNNYK